MFWDEAWLAFSVFLENYQYLALAAGIIAALALLPRRRVFFPAVFITLILSLALKLFFHEARPCAEDIALVPCPSDFGFPSGHATFAGLLAIGSLGSTWALLFVPIGLLIAYSRIFLGVHTVGQVLAGFALAVATYLIIWRLRAEEGQK